MFRFNLKLKILLIHYNKKLSYNEGVDNRAKIEHLLTKNVEEVIEKNHLISALKSGKKLVVKYGADPTAPDLHLGHLIALRKLREFQDLGHKVVFIIGDFTARIGDPSGKSKTRPPLSPEEIKKNSQTYLEQVGKILDVKKAQICFNSRWLSKIKFDEILKLTSKFTVARILERDDFASRFKKGSAIGLHELLYPLIQAYDSVQIKADVEIGGSDQRFNMLSGRELQKEMGQKSQDVIIQPLLLGTDGKRKMSKSLGNYVGLAEPANIAFGKIMSIPDTLIIDYFELLTERTPEDIGKINHALQRGEVNPRDLKIELTKEIVAALHSKKEAEQAAKEFEKVFSRRSLPSQMPEVKISKKEMTLLDLVAATKTISSKSEARRLILQGGVKINSNPKKEPFEKILIKPGMVIRIGKLKFVRIKK
jgi:tyrosyl-tRNA synthetase